MLGLVLYWQRHLVPYIRARFGRDDRGASLVEYALLVALIAVVCVVALRFLGSQTDDTLSDVGEDIDQDSGDNQ